MTDASQGGAALSAEERAELRALCERATPGPWITDEGDPFCVGAPKPSYPAQVYSIVTAIEGGAGYTEKYNARARADAAFIAAARTALPLLLDALERSERLLALAHDYVEGEFCNPELAEEIALLLDPRAAPPEQGRPTGEAA